MSKIVIDEQAKRRIEFVTACLKRLAEIKGVELTEGRIDGYTRVLVKSSEPALNYAFKKAVEDIPKFPDVSDLKRLAGEFWGTAEGQKLAQERDSNFAERYKLALREQRTLPEAIERMKGQPA